MDVGIPLLYTTAGAAKRLNCGKTTLYHLIMTGQLESITIGRARRIPAVALEAYVERLRHAATADDAA
ncbi:helix-turn-helix domain-containing protein [Micromonospora cremea]|uniref:DNA binding domain-containing protein, excisionase family n=1 Tax=Micromonospora cremea TaxID=709881 RepID=A0A1N5ZX69_9ACTN|nr:helix-turn-helix domain-containing protein [Micromonospora cremea]SIN26325.1 DNA binding domain-containing protein, excisionase family [Micromonospora cremea]